MKKQENSIKFTAALVFLVTGWVVAFGLWFKSDYAWDEMRKAKEDAEHQRDRAESFWQEAQRASADAYYVRTQLMKRTRVWSIPATSAK